MKKFCIMLSPKLVEELKAEADEMSLSLSGYIRMLLTNRNN